MFGDAFCGKRVLVTGHTGFKGSWLCFWLSSLGAEVHGIALDPVGDLYSSLGLNETVVGDNRIDIRQDLTGLVKEISPHFVFHLAAQPIVRVSYDKPFETVDINILGVVRVLESIRCLDRCSVVIVTTDKVYENREWHNGYREGDTLGGHDPYSASKACVEILTASYRQSYFSDRNIMVATARAGNVIGGGDWAKDRIVPDCVRSLLNSKQVEVRNKLSTRPWQHVLEPLSGYLWLAATLDNPSIAGLATPSQLDAFNFGPLLTSNRSVETLVEEILKYFGGSWNESVSDSSHEAGKLHLAIDKAYHLLNWGPTWNFERTVKNTAQWYKAHHDGKNMRDITVGQIFQYCSDATSAGWSWVK